MIGEDSPCAVCAVQVGSSAIQVWPFQPDGSLVMPLPWGPRQAGQSAA